MTFVVGEYKTVIAYPYATGNSVLELFSELKGLFAPVIFFIFVFLLKLRGLFLTDVASDLIALKVQEIKGVIESENNLLAIFTPIHVLW